MQGCFEKLNTQNLEFVFFYGFLNFNWLLLRYSKFEFRFYKRPFVIPLFDTDMFGPVNLIYKFKEDPISSC